MNRKELLKYQVQGKLSRRDAVKKIKGAWQMRLGRIQEVGGELQVVTGKIVDSHQLLMEIAEAVANARLDLNARMGNSRMMVMFEKRPVDLLGIGDHLLDVSFEEKSNLLCITPRFYVPHPETGNPVAASYRTASSLDRKLSSMLSTYLEFEKGPTKPARQRTGTIC